MQSAAAALGEVLAAREFDVLPRAVDAFVRESSVDELRIAVARFAVLAFAPSLHSTRALVACRAAMDDRIASDAQRVALLTECARYAAASRPPWHEPPLLDPPPAGDAPDLESALRERDRAAAERWLASRIDGADRELERFVSGESLLLLDAVRDLEPRLGAKGRHALLRTVVWSLPAEAGEDELPFDAALDRAERERGSVDAVSAVLAAHARRKLSGTWTRGESAHAYPCEPYRLGRDFAQTLLAHAIAPELESAQAERLLAAVHENLQHGENFEEWSLA